MINYDLKKIKAVFFDIDGVLSKETISLGADGQPRRTVNIKDGYALQLAIKRGLKIAVITGAKVEELGIRYHGLGIDDVFLGCKVKIEVYRSLMQKYRLTHEEVAYMGDDIPDYEIMQKAGCTCCPQDACTDIKAISTYVSPYNGGEGCARDVIEQVLKANGLWLSSAKAFGW